jgi:hypothetical protein
MDISKAEKIGKVMNNINRCKSFLGCLKDRGYPDSFEIYYRDYKACDLEEDVLDIIIEHYENELERYNEELKKL